jgi:hypothetical protein
MLGIRYLKCPPTNHVILYKNGRIVRQGPGHSFFYFAPTSTLVMVPVGSVDVPFVFEEVTQDYQDITIQGQLTYRVKDALKLSQLMDFTVDARGRFTSEDPGKLNERLIQLAQVRSHSFAQSRNLQSMLLSCDELGSQLGTALSDSTVAAMPKRCRLMPASRCCSKRTRQCLHGAIWPLN